MPSMRRVIWPHVLLSSPWSWSSRICRMFSAGGVVVVMHVLSANAEPAWPSGMSCHSVVSGVLVVAVLGELVHVLAEWERRAAHVVQRHDLHALVDRDAGSPARIVQPRLRGGLGVERSPHVAAVGLIVGRDDDP